MSEYRVDETATAEVAGPYRFLIVVHDRPVYEHKASGRNYLRFNTGSLATRVLYDVRQAGLDEASLLDLSAVGTPFSDMPTIHGECPMGCGATLVLSHGGHVVCGRKGCPRPVAASELLHLPTDHVAYIDAHHFTIEHPARERIEGTMHTCEFNLALQKLDGPPVPNGRYRMVKRDHDPTSQSRRSDDIGYDFERIEAA